MIADDQIRIKKQRLQVTRRSDQHDLVHFSLKRSIGGRQRDITEKTLTVQLAEGSQ